MSDPIINLNVTGLHPKVAEGARKTIDEAKARGIIVGLNSGLRTAEEQDRLYCLGRSVENPDGKSVGKPMGNIVTNARAWDSWHNYGLAVDIVFKDDHGNWTWDRPDASWKALGDVGKLFGFEWGGDWTSFRDLPHFQMRGKLTGIPDAKSILFSQGIEAIWTMV